MKSFRSFSIAIGLMAFAAGAAGCSGAGNSQVASAGANIEVTAADAEHPENLQGIWTTGDEDAPFFQLFLGSTDAAEFPASWGDPRCHASTCVSSGTWSAVSVDGDSYELTLSQTSPTYGELTYTVSRTFTADGGVELILQTAKGQYEYTPLVVSPRDNAEP